MLSQLIKSAFGIAATEPAAVSAPRNVYVCLMGGLGNQLFQYAFARYLTAQGIAVDGLVANLLEGDKYARQLLVHTLSRTPVVNLDKAQLATLKIVADENGLAIRDSLLRDLQTAVVCRGYWQHAQYADAVAVELAGDLRAHGERHYPGSEAVECVLHVRRHDYGHIGLLPLEYYRAALAHCGWPRFKVVTDEPNFSHFMFSQIQGYAGVVRGDLADPWGDLFLMSRAPLQVIANSSFSWWAAWLGRASGATTTVVAPAEWSLLEGEHPCPAGWHRFDTQLQRP